MAWPQTTPENLYNLIYEAGPALPGYKRYWKYANLVQGSQAPLTALAKQEECYWAVENQAKKLPGGSRILEVGSGLGYLTYALHRAGYAAHGIEISDTATRLAKNRFGALFETADLFSHAASHPGRYDLVILTEVIEHIEAPLPFLHAAMRMLRPSGQLLVTTPNKSAYAASVLWDSELPPVHWWWFTEEFFRQLCRTARCLAAFVDFTPYYRAGYGCLLPAVVQPHMVRKRQPCFSADGGLIAWTDQHESPVLATIKRVRFIRKLIRQFRFIDRPAGCACNSGVLAVVLTKPENGR